MTSAPAVRRLAVGLATLAAFGTGVAAGARTPVVEGTADAVYGVAASVFVPGYRNAGFRQEARDGELRVEVSAGPGWSRAGFSRPAATGADEVARFAAAAASGAALRSEAVARVVHAVAARIGYAAGPDLAEEPAEVLARGRASCVGLSNLAAAALRAIGIEARIARGALVSRADGTVVPHRWLEVYYPDAGWVFSDPTESVNYVSAYHVLLTPPGDPDPGYEPRAALGAGLRLLHARDALLAVDLHPGRPSGLGERRGAPAQYLATVLGSVLPAPGVTLVLRGNGAAWRTEPQPGGAFSFPGLAPGRYVIEGSRAPSDAVALPVSVSAAELVRVDLRLP